MADRDAINRELQELGAYQSGMEQAVAAGMTLSPSDQNARKLLLSCEKRYAVLNARALHRQLHEAIHMWEDMRKQLDRYRALVAKHTLSADMVEPYINAVVLMCGDCERLFDQLSLVAKSQGLSEGGISFNLGIVRE